jgi:hypothetical protein
METVIEPRQQAFRERPHMQCGAAAVWFTHPAGLVFQLVEPARLTVQLGAFLADSAYPEAVRRFPDCHSLTIVLDLSLMLARTQASRSLLIGRMRAAADRCARLYLIVPANISPALRRSFEASLELAKELGIDAALVGSARQVVASCALVPAPDAP